MIIGFFHPGSGLGNQLFRYLGTRVLAEDRGLKFGMIGTENFKGKSFMDLDMGEELNIPTHTEYPAGKLVADVDLPLWEENSIHYNPEINFVPDNTIIDGEFQDEKYFGHRLADLRVWLRTEVLQLPEDMCVINFRGGEFALFPELFLSKDYWDKGIAIMKGKNSNMKFEVHTDDPDLAKQFFPDYECIHDISLNWRSIRYAKNLIIANSSFPILPSLLNEDAHVIAPRYWARPHSNEWSMPQNYYRKFQYI